MQLILDSLSIISNIVVVIGAFAVGVGNLLRFAQAKELNIPFKITHSNITDFVDVFAVMIILIGGGFLVPSFLINLEADPLQISAIIILTLIASAITAFNLIPKSKSIDKQFDNWGSFYSKVYFTLRALVIILVIPAMLYHVFVLRDPQPASTAFLNIFWIIYALLMSFISIGYATSKMIISSFYLRGMTMVITTEVEKNGVKERYLIVMRYSTKEWILLPCKLIEKDNITTLYFENDRFIIQTLENLKINNIRCNGGIHPIDSLE